MHYVTTFKTICPYPNSHPQYVIMNLFDKSMNVTYLGEKEVSAEITLILAYQVALKPCIFIKQKWKRQRERRTQCDPGDILDRRSQYFISSI